jgi:hypothetical protein
VFLGLPVEARDGYLERVERNMAPVGQSIREHRASVEQAGNYARRGAMPGRRQQKGSPGYTKRTSAVFTQRRGSAKLYRWT